MVYCIEEMAGLTCDCGELVATCELNEGYSTLSYMLCVAVVVVLWRALGADDSDEDPPETMYG